MGRQLLKLSISSLKRRWKDIFRACIATFLAIFFITGVLLFQENMYQWQLASNKERFGDWLIMETNTGKPNPVIVDNPLMDGYSVAESALKLYNAEWKLINRYVGYMSPEFLEQSYIDLEEGRMPKADNEIAMDWDTLLRMGITAKLGQTVTLYYYEDNNEHKLDNRRQEDFVLVGILESYTDTWKRGKNLPGVLVTREKYESYDNNAQNMFIHKIRDNVKTDDYSLLFDNIKEESGSSVPIYNDYLYEYKPWGSDSVYNYMYVVVMTIGVAAIIYQLIIYNNSRKNSYKIMCNMGAEKSQIAMISLIENAFILVVPGLMGIGMAALLGKLICVFIEIPMGIPFYYVKWTILLKGFLSIMLAVVIQLIIEKLVIFRGVFTFAKKKRSAGTRTYKNVKGSVVNKRNLTRQISFRLTAANSIWQNIAIRLLALAVCVVVVFCSIKIHKAYVQYKDNEMLPDFVGYQEEENNYYQSMWTFIPFDVKEGQTYMEAYSEFLEQQGTTNMSPGYSYRKHYKIPTQEEVQLLIYGEGDLRFRLLGEGKCAAISGVHFQDNKYMKNATTSLDTGMTEKIISTIESTAGVQEVSYSSYESRRMWTWDGMTMDNLSIEKLIMSTGSEKVKPYADKYLFATQYQKPTEELYSRLSKYIDESRLDYDAFSSGEQIIVFVDENLDEKFDDSIKPGMKINYHYYPLIAHNAPESKYYELLRDALSDVSYEELYGAEFYKKEMYGACVEPQVATVIQVTDEIEEEFKDLIVGFGYYTAIASTELGKKACDNQNKLLEECIQTDLPEELRLNMQYNQMTIRYDITASFSATDNIIENFCKENNITYNTMAEQKEIYRTELINAVLQYGITLIAAIVINVLIVAIIAKSRLEARKERFALLSRLGADSSRIVSVCMIEAVRESLWCVFTMPLVLLVQYVLCRKATGKAVDKRSHKKVIEE